MTTITIETLTVLILLIGFVYFQYKSFRLGLKTSSTTLTYVPVFFLILFTLYIAF